MSEARKIYKYALGASRETDDGAHIVTMPRGARILHVGEQHNNLMLWALVSPWVYSQENRIFYIIGTGHDVPDRVGMDRTDCDFIGTAIVAGGDFVFHVFEVR